jgi:propanol-preferring alcohol dehydrogenase
MASMMKPAVVHRFDQPLPIEEVPVPPPSTGELVVKIMASRV